MQMGECRRVLLQSRKGAAELQLDIEAIGNRAFRELQRAQSFLRAIESSSAAPR